MIKIRVILLCFFIFVEAILPNADSYCDFRSVLHNNIAQTLSPEDGDDVVIQTQIDASEEWEGSADNRDKETRRTVASRTSCCILTIFVACLQHLFDPPLPTSILKDRKKILSINFYSHYLPRLLQPPQT
ncbi:hypothetical protein RYH73_14340 [Olivibacter sp. CPCC 100613]|uniref:hypothetical protein n=1 Tax=Olivibacter sp. CPCC 100613 TaxID=3079931 RepID=UPI002FF4D4B9